MKIGILNLAISEAKRSTYRQRLGAVVFSGKRIISSGYNSSCRSAKSLHPKFQLWEGSVHAEVAAILNARVDLSGMNILVVRLNNLGELMYSKPCKHCQMYLEYVGIHRIFYVGKLGMVEEL